MKLTVTTQILKGNDFLPALKALMQDAGLTADNRWELADLRKSVNDTIKKAVDIETTLAEKYTELVKPEFKAGLKETGISSDMIIGDTDRATFIKEFGELNSTEHTFEDVKSPIVINNRTKLTAHQIYTLRELGLITREKKNDA
jgi:hypothetical protein